MVGVRRLIFAFCVCLFFVSGYALASAYPPNSAPGIFATQGAASAACFARAAWEQAQGSTDQCTFYVQAGGPYVDTGNPQVCVTPLKYSGGYENGYGSYLWCVPATCVGQDSGDPSQQWGAVYENGIIYCNRGCMGAFHMDSGVGSLQFANGDGGSWGHFVSNGNRCQSAIDSSLFKPAPPAPSLCDHGGASCYNPQRGFCATTEYGEQICEPAPTSGSGGCAAGATGATCVGNGTPPPTPPDPPVQKGQPPDSSATASGTDSGGTTNNYTTNNYSGTSPGSGGGGSPSSGSSAGTGSQSNTGGSGNTRPPGTSSGTDSTGKCADGSVPTASGCSGTATDSGDCKTPPQCYGDAVLCGQFKEQVAIRCNTAKAVSGSSAGANYGTPSSALADAGVPSDGGASTDPSGSGLVSSSDIGQAGFDSSGLGFGTTCPASPTFSFHGHTWTIDLTPFCNFLTMFGWLLLLISFLVGLRIVATGKA